MTYPAQLLNPVVSPLRISSCWYVGWTHFAFVDPQPEIRLRWMLINVGPYPDAAFECMLPINREPHGAPGKRRWHEWVLRKGAPVRFRCFPDTNF